jgi:hypothetical protein
MESQEKSAMNDEPKSPSGQFTASIEQADAQAQLNAAIESRDISRVRQAISTECDLNTVDESGKTPLRIAAEIGIQALFSYY